ncbi:MAG: LysR family transcriptional regulator [Novosphingobium sp.]
MTQSMKRDQLEGLVMFIAVAEAKGFTPAAVRLGVTPSAMSQAIRNLEERLGHSLFSRTTRSVNLTEAGEQFYERVAPGIRDLVSASEELATLGNQPQGVLRLNLPRAGFITILRPIIDKFCEDYPRIRIDLSIESSLVDIVDGRFDAGIRFGNLIENDMVAVNLGPPIAELLVASPAYIAKFGMPDNPKELLEHSCIGFRYSTNGQIRRWKLLRGVEEVHLSVNCRIITNDPLAAVECAIEGAGITYSASCYVHDSIARGELVRILPDWGNQLPGLALYYPSGIRVPAKLRVFIDYLRKHLNRQDSFT